MNILKNISRSKRPGGAMVLLHLALISAFAVKTFRAHAGGFPVVDLSNLAQNILHVLNSGKQIAHQITQISHLMTQIQNQIRELKTFDNGSSFAAIQGQMMQQMDSLNRLLGQLTVIRYQGASIQHEFQGLFPPGAAGAERSLSRYRDTFARWNDELMNSSRTAMEAQSLIAKMTTRNLELTRLLDQSAGADGVVRQLQVVNELLALGTGHLLDVSTALIATGRMTSTMTAMGAAQERVASEAAFRARKHYTSRGKKVPVLNALPRIP